MKKSYITPNVQVIPLVMDELMVLTASGNLPPARKGIRWTMKRRTTVNKA